MNRRVSFVSGVAICVSLLLPTAAPARTVGFAPRMPSWTSHTSPYYSLNFIYVASVATDSIVVYRSDQHDDAHPYMTIAGPKTKLDGPVGLTFDQDGRLYVVNHGNNSSVTVYAAGAHGNVAPIRTLTGPKTRLRNIESPADYPWGSIAVDLRHNRLFIGRVSPDQTSPYGLDVLIFRADAHGNEAPLGSIGYPNNDNSSYIDPGIYGDNFPPAVILTHDGRQLIVSNEQYQCCHGSDGWIYYRSSDLAGLGSFEFYINSTVIGPAYKPLNKTLVSTGFNVLDIWTPEVMGEAGLPDADPLGPTSYLANPLNDNFTAVTSDSDDTIWALSGSTVLEGFEAGHTTPRIITGLVGASAIATIRLRPH